MDPEMARHWMGENNDCGSCDDCGSCPSKRPTITDCELIEFSGQNEYDKFRHIQPITQAEIDNCNIDSLAHQLQR